MFRGTGVEMLGVETPIAVALIAAVPTTIGAIGAIWRAKNEIMTRNSEEHAAAQVFRTRTAEVLEDVRVNVREIDRKVDQHIHDHATGRL